MSSDSSVPSPVRKSPALKKPSKDFPLSIHQGRGYWCKKVRGKVYYFGKVADDLKGQRALLQWLEDRDDILAGRKPRRKAGALTVAELCNEFLTFKSERRDNGELSPRTFQTYHAACGNLIKAFGRTRTVEDIGPDDFQKLRRLLSKDREAVSLRNEMQRVRCVFKFGFDEGHLLTPIKFGQAFVKPKSDVVRRARELHRAEHGDRMFEANEIREMLDGKLVTLPDGSQKSVRGASQPLRSMILLAANCAFGQSDLSALPIRAVDLTEGWVNFARVKTAVGRRCPLWPETVAAIREWLAIRPKAKMSADDGLLFLTVRGSRWVKLNKSGSPADAIGQEFAKLLRAMDMKRDRLSFYGLRRGLETIGGETTDQIAVDAIMRHVPAGMGANYRERIGDDRLKRVVEHVRAWIFSK